MTREVSLIIKLNVIFRDSASDENAHSSREDADLGYATIDFMDKDILLENTNLYKIDDGNFANHLMRN